MCENRDLERLGSMGMSSVVDCCRWFRRDEMELRRLVELCGVDVEGPSRSLLS